jgi:hypothetical protein
VPPPHHEFQIKYCVSDLSHACYMFHARQFPWVSRYSGILMHLPQTLHTHAFMAQCLITYAQGQLYVYLTVTKDTELMKWLQCGKCLSASTAADTA